MEYVKNNYVTKGSLKKLESYLYKTIEIAKKERE